MMVMLAEGEHDEQTGQAVQKLREIAGEADFEAVEFIGLPEPVLQRRKICTDTQCT